MPRSFSANGLRDLSTNGFRTPRTLLFDLDDTLYPKSTGLMKEVSRRIGVYIGHCMKLAPEEADKMRIKYRDSFGSSLVGLYHIEKIDPAAYEKYVYDIDYSQYLSHNGELAEILNSLPYEKVVYTNGAERHARAVLEQTGLGGCFKKIVAIENVFYYAKPMPQSFREMMRITGINASETLFFDDQERNLEAAAKFGMGTALVSEKTGIIELLREL